MKIKLLGPGCVKCRKLYEETQKAVAQAGVQAEIEKVEKIDEIMAFGVMMTPAIVIDGEVKCAGRVPQSAEIVKWITNASKE